MRNRGTFLALLLIVAANAALFGGLELLSYAIIQHYGLRRDNTVIFNAQNGRDEGFMVQYDDRLGYRLVTPHADAQHIEDSLGRIFPREKSAGVYRIICFGGSTTYGVGADKTNSFPVILQDLLNGIYGNCGLHFEVLNAGVMGYHSWHSRLRVNLEFSHWQPDLILGMDAVNDLVASTIVRDNLALDQEKSRLLELTNAKRDTGWLERVDAFLLNHVHAYMLLRHLTELLPSRRLATTDYHAGIETFGYRDNMEAISGSLRAKGIDFAIINYPWAANKHFVASGPAFLQGAASPLYLFGRDYFEAVNRKLSQTIGEPIIDPQARFDAVVDADPPKAQLVYFDEVHLAKYGNLLLAQTIARTLPQVASFDRYTSSCRGRDTAWVLDNAIKLMDPRIHFRNGWPEGDILPVPAAVIALDNIKISSADVAGHACYTVADKARPGMIRLQVTREADLPQMRYNFYNAFFYPRVVGENGAVTISLGSRDLFHLAGTSSGWTGLSDKFGLVLPRLTTGEDILLILENDAQVWGSGESLLFYGDNENPGH